MRVWIEREESADEKYLLDGGQRDLTSTLDPCHAPPYRHAQSSCVNPACGDVRESGVCKARTGRCRASLADALYCNLRCV
ncbi:hypothetical protein E2C01_012230 [Portunus trituberculatus]|uniref:Uncharacterized protein n=1 Tax=Portunus trituberculatus TaxID=210409 RepID=A0A5B7DDL7_PORTR|nr:hypothetical protein [Portunus trituberculatus]